jgi:DHA2 family multidrug resistance protein
LLLRCITIILIDQSSSITYLVAMAEPSPVIDPIRRRLITITVMAATFMQVLDMTIANVALPHMQAALGATPETIVWVLTSYILMAAIGVPITGWLEARLGRRKLFAIAVGGFTISSAACGLAGSLGMMVGARALQGAFGALIVPIAQATMLDSSPREKHPQAMMIFSMGVTIGPIIGPVLGGWLTDNYNWRWVFLINLPVGILSFAGILGLLDEITLPRRRFDLFGFILLSVALASLQLVLDRGNQKDWLDSIEILIEAGVAIAAFWMFVIHVIFSKAPLIPIPLIRDRNFVIAVTYTMMIMGVGIAGPALMAPMLQQFMGYDTMGAGMLMMPRGIGALVSMPLATMLTKRVDARVLIAIGLLLIGGSLWILTGLDLETDSKPFIYSAVLQGVGMGLAFLPLTVLAFSSLPGSLRTEGAAFYNLARNLGGSITLSIMGALLARNLQVNHADLGARISSVRVPIDSGYLEQLGLHGAAVTAAIDAEINRQAGMIAYLDDFWLMMWIAIAASPFLLLLRKPKTASTEPPPLLVE